MASIGSLPSLAYLFSALPLSSATGSSAAPVVSLPSIDPAALLNYFDANAMQSSVQASAQRQQSSASTTSAQTPPWETPQLASSPQRDAQTLAMTNFVNLDTATLTSGASASDKLAEDNQKLFALYQGVNSLYYLASMAQRSGATAGQQVGYNTRFQQGLTQVQSFINSTTFNDLTLQAGQTSASLTSTVGVPSPSFSHTGATVVGDANVSSPLPNVSTNDSFDISVTKGGTTTTVPIVLSQVQGPLTIDNIDSYINQQLAANGFATRFTRVITKGSINNPTAAAYGIGITPAPSETISLSSASATPALYLTGTTGSSTGTSTTLTADGASTTATTPPDQQGRLVKLSNLSGTPTSTFNVTENTSSGTTTAQASVVDSNGNVYVVGNATGSFGNQLNQGTQDVYLSKYDSSGNLQWTQLLGSAASASGYSVALDPATGGVVVAGSTTADLSTAAVADGNTDSFVASYDAQGNQTWSTQVQTLANNQAASVSVDASGNIYIGGQVTGTIGAGQTNTGGTNAYVAKLDGKGNVVYEQQFGPSGNDQVAATATTADGGLVVASVQNGEAIVSKYANGDATSTPVWTEDLGSLQNGSLGTLAVSGNQIYLSGTTTNGSLTAGGQASVANASSGGTSAFVFNITDQGTAATANYVSYVGAGSSNQGNSVTVGPDGTVYLAGTTTGTFAGQTRNVSNVPNMFVSALNSNGSVNWTQQYGGLDGQSTGNSVAIDPTGASVLDALGLPRGTIDINQSEDLTTQTTLRAGDSFNIDIQGTTTRNTTITIDPGETLNSLVGKINDALLFSGKASVSYGANGETLKIAVNPGVTANIVAGPTDTDALGRLGITPGALTAPSKNPSTANNSSTATPSSAKSVFGLGLTGTLDISTSSGARAAHSTLGNVLSAIRNIYQTINTPPSQSNGTTQQSTGTVPTYLTSQLANYNLALSMLSSGSFNTIA